MTLSNVEGSLLDAGIEVERPEIQKENLPLEGKTFVFTGSLEKYTRSEVERKVESLGARYSSSVSGNTDYVVVGTNPGGKLERREKAQGEDH